MNSVVVYRRGEAIGDSFMGSGNGGGSVDDDFSRRLGNIENDVAELKAEVRAISATIPHLATKADLKAEIGNVRAEIGKVETQVASMESAIIKWIIATVLMTSGIAFSIAKFVH